MNDSDRRIKMKDLALAFLIVMVAILVLLAIGILAAYILAGVL